MRGLAVDLLQALFEIGLVFEDLIRHRVHQVFDPAIGVLLDLIEAIHDPLFALILQILDPHGQILHLLLVAFEELRLPH